VNYFTLKASLRDQDNTAQYLIIILMETIKDPYISAPDKSLWTAHSGGVLVQEPTRLTGRGKAAVIAGRAGPSLGFLVSLRTGRQ
jgi:hypothetical protein